MSDIVDTFVGEVRRFHGEEWVEDAVTFVVHEMDADGGHDAGHLLRVLSTAHDIADEEPDGDRETIGAAVLFHDIVNLPKDHPERHLASTKSAELAAEVLTETAFPNEKLPVVAEAIRCHSYSAGLEPESIEAKIVSDADNMEAIGAFGIARTFYVGGRMKSAIVHPFDPWAETRERDDLAYSVDHFFEKLLQLKGRMYTERGREIAEERHAFMETFLEQLRSELP